MFPITTWQTKSHAGICNKHALHKIYQHSFIIKQMFVLELYHTATEHQSEAISGLETLCQIYCHSSLLKHTVQCSENSWQFYISYSPAGVAKPKQFTPPTLKIRVSCQLTLNVRRLMRQSEHGYFTTHNSLRQSRLCQ